MSMIGPVQSRCHEGSPVGKINLRWEGFVEKVGFEPGVKDTFSLLRSCPYFEYMKNYRNGYGSDMDIYL